MNPCARAAHIVARLHRTKEDIPKNGIVIDATAPIARVVDEIVRQSETDVRSSGWQD
jgi:hypothetical protein